jgi:hypothetical protein
MSLLLGSRGGFRRPFDRDAPDDVRLASFRRVRAPSGQKTDRSHCRGASIARSDAESGVTQETFDFKYLKFLSSTA